MAWPGRLGGVVLLAGFAGVVASNAWSWRDDRRLAARVRLQLARPRPDLSATPRVSILVAAWNEAGKIRRHIESVIALQYPNREYVLCAGGPDGTLAVARRYAREGMVVLEQAPGEGKQRALRRALGHCSGALVFLTDADCLLDDVSFERTLEPLIDGDEAVTTGGSMPPAEQRRHSDFAAYQWAVQQYSLAHAPAYVGGLLGRNVALRRDALEMAGAFGADVPTGTDYHLAKALLRHGYRIRNVPTSLVVTPYAETWSQYARQQRRWLRNVALLGARSGAWAEAWASVRTSLLGAAMILGSATVLGGGLPFALWCIGVAHSAGAKLRYLGFGRVLDGRRAAPPWRAACSALAYTFGEFVVWALPLLDYPVPARRRRW